MTKVNRDIDRTALSCWLIRIMPLNFPFVNSRLKTEQIFEGLTAGESDMLLQASVTHVYRKGEIIFREGGIPTGIFHIKSGRVKKYKSTAKGGEQIIYICSEGELLGYHAVLGEERYPDSTAALTSSEITFIPRETFLQVLNKSSTLSNRLLKALAHEFSLYINSFTNLATKTVRERLAFNLLLLEDKFRSSEHASGSVDIQLSRTDFANMIGTAKETLVRLLKEFKQKKLIQTTTTSIRIINHEGILAEANLMGNTQPKKTAR